MELMLAEAIAEGKRRRRSVLSCGRRMVRSYSTCPLKLLCRDAIVKNLDFYMDMQEPFACMPKELHTFLQEKIEQDKVDANTVRKCLVSWSTEELHMYDWTVEEAQQVLQLAEDKCAAGLVILKMWYMISPSLLPALQRALQRLVNLRNVHLKFTTGVDDDTFAVIGRSLPHLRLLSVETAYDNEVLTDSGLAFLCVDDGRHGKCKQLEQLEFGELCGTYKRVTVHGVLTLLENLPNVRRIIHSASFEALMMFINKHNPKNLNFTTCFKINSNESSNSTEIQNKDIEKLLNYKPKIKSITLNGDVNLQSLFQINDEILELKCDSVSTSFMKELFFNIGSNITSLDITNTGETEMDLSIIGKCCTKLESLNWYCKSTTTFIHNFEKKFTFLTYLCTSSQNFPLVALESILSSKNFRFIFLSSVDTLTDEFLIRMINISKSNNKFLSKLNYFSIENVNKVSFDVLKLFVCYTTAVSSTGLEIRDCAKISETQVQQLKSFITSLFEPQ